MPGSDKLCARSIMEALKKNTQRISFQRVGRAHVRFIFAPSAGGEFRRQLGIAEKCRLGRCPRR